ncbi:MAG: biopolymer transporter ExbD [Bacteroidetes bacterium]|nr:biopolymer transporter ExbD [Bacteroidota bacterium]
MNLQTRNKRDPNFNMASLADVIFLLLIFFMLTSTLVAPNAIKLLLPRADGQELSKQTVMVSITADLKYYVNDRLVDFEDLQSVIYEEIRNIKDPVIVLRIDETVPHGKTVALLSIGRKLNANMILATQPED